MADVIEKADHQHRLALNIHLQHRKEEPDIKPTGYCHYCEEVVEHPKLFCNGECATKYS